MKYDVKYFDDFFEDPDSFSDEDYLEKSKEFLVFMKENIGSHNITQEIIDDWEEHCIGFEQDLAEQRELMRKLKTVDIDIEMKAIKLDEALTRAMEANGGKPIPMFINLPKRHNSN
jgi:hypothetical protein